jgi:enoyl-CoA hydratase/carnithine racemase
VSSSVRLEISDGVGVIIVDSPPVNSLSNGTLEELEQVATDVIADERVRAIVLTGTGEKAFLAGADLEELGGALGQSGWIEHHTALTRHTLGLWEQLPQPIVAAVQASAVGGGLEFALVCDLIVADPKARLGSPEVKLGLIPGAGATQRLPQWIPRSVAKELILLGRLIDAHEAKALGLVNRVSAPGEALAESLELAGRLATLPAVAVRGIKRAMSPSHRDGFEAGLDRERQLFLEAFNSQDVHEGVEAFLAKREPRFVHR